MRRGEDSRRSTVPCSRASNGERAIADCWSTCSWHDEIGRWRRPQATTGGAADGRCQLSQVSWCCSFEAMQLCNDTLLVLLYYKFYTRKLSYRCAIRFYLTRNSLQRIGLFSLAARSWINIMNITKYKKLGLMSIVKCKYQHKIIDCT